MTTPLVLCTQCKHYQGKLKCTAFRSKKIPQEILSMLKSHKAPFPGDNGIQFEPKKGSEQDKQQAKL